MITRADIIDAVAAFAPPGIQESWDNSGVQVGPADTSACTGVMLCVDVTPEVVIEARAARCNLIISHHPLIFKGLRSITGTTQVEQAVIEAIKADITVYSAHTSLDSTAGGISWQMARMLGIEPDSVLLPQPHNPSIGLGVVGNLPAEMPLAEFAEMAADTFRSPHPRASRPDGSAVRRVALCGGSGGEFIPRAIAAGADAYVTADVRYHDFVDHGRSIFLLDVGHFESESCAKEIFSHIITEKFPNFAVYYSQQQNPIQYFS